MYRPAVYAIDDIALLHDVMRERGFATLAAVRDGQLHFAYAPVVVDAEPCPFGELRFHLARANPVAELNDAPVHISFIAADSYVSPDWYETKEFVPTWNYIAVEGRGRVRQMDQSELHRLLVDLSASAEGKLSPKLPWTIDRIPEERLAVLRNSIRGFTITLDRLQGKFKLSQDKKRADIAGVIFALEARGDTASLAVARAMEAARERKHPASS